MGVKVDWDPELFAKGAHELECGVRLAESGHVFDGEKVGAEFLELVGHCDVVLERIFWTACVENVSGVTNRRFADAAGLKHGVDCDAHVFDGVERIEDAEDIDALRVGFAHEFLDYVVGIGRVADSICAAQQHLEADVRDALAQLAKALPRIFMQKTQSGVEGGAAPHFDTEQIRKSLGYDARGG